jgi:hypothetical protein
VPTTSWLGSVWSLRGGERLLIGQVEAVDGEVVTLSIVGLDGAAPEGVDFVPSGEPGRALARIHAVSLLQRWKRIGPVVPA